jgi:hypothetical protein
LAMGGEDGLANSDQNNRIILRSIGIGPKGTQVTLGRILSQTVINDIPEDDTFYTDPAILVNGDLKIAGNSKIYGSEGNVHANGNIHGDGNSYEIKGDLTASGVFTGNAHADGLVAANQPSINVPAINANDFRELADYIMSNTGTVLHRTTGVACPSKCGWTFDNATKSWSKSGSMPEAFTYYVEGSVSIHGTGNSVMTKLSIIAEGSITLTGNGKFKPENTSAIQFVTNGDFTLAGNVDADDAGVDMDGQILVREQFDIRGNSKFQGRVMVENRDSATNAWHADDNPNGRRGSSTLSANEIGGNMKVTYNGGLDEVESTIPGVPADPTYTNNISGWIEQ